MSSIRPTSPGPRPPILPPPPANNNTGSSNPRTSRSQSPKVLGSFTTISGQTAEGINPLTQNNSRADLTTSNQPQSPKFYSIETGTNGGRAATPPPLPPLNIPTRAELKEGQRRASKSPVNHRPGSKSPINPLVSQRPALPPGIVYVCGEQ